MQIFNLKMNFSAGCSDFLGGDKAVLLCRKDCFREFDTFVLLIGMFLFLWVYGMPTFALREQLSLIYSIVP